MSSTVEPRNYYDTRGARAVPDPEPYEIESVPPTGDGNSRFALTGTPNGNPSTPAATANHVYATLVEQFKKSLTPWTPEFADFVVKRVALVSTLPEYELRIVERFRQVPTFVPLKRDGRFKSIPESGGALLDGLFSGEIDPAGPTDDQIYEAALEHARATEASGTDCKRLSHIVAKWVGLRYGIDYPIDRMGV